MLEKSIERGFRSFSLPSDLSDRIWATLGINPTSENLKQLAQDVLRMSDFYIEWPEEKTPWEESWCLRAQMAYFLPLNYIRNKAVFQEAQRFNFFQGVQSALDIGSGLGAVSLALSEAPLQWKALEISEIAQAKSRFLNPRVSFVPRPEPVDLITFSFSMTEDLPLEKIWNQAQNLMILEPALKNDSRKLMQLRQDLIAAGWSAWAPCTHDENCPLLVSPNDWCHDRIHFQAPDWFLELESHLPMKNSNLAYSYLLMSKRPAPRILDSARVVSDFLIEKGKSKITLCHSGTKELASWLHRNLEPEEISRGSLVRAPNDKEIKGTESRLTKDLEIIFPNISSLHE